MLKYVAVIVGSVLIVLKVAGMEPIASMSWWFVTSPLWGWALLAFIVIFAHEVSKEWK